MLAPALANRDPATLQPLLERLGRRYLAGTPLSIGDNGAVFAQFYRSRITSALQPVVRARDREVLGHQALLRVENGTGGSVAPWSLFANALDDRMPPDAVDNPVAFVRAAISYRIRGYRVLVPVRSVNDVELSHVFLADPHFVSVDAADALEGPLAQRFLKALARRGIQLLARGIDSPSHEALARAAGVELLQGFRLGRP